MDRGAFKRYCGFVQEIRFALYFLLPHLGCSVLLVEL